MTTFLAAAGLLLIGFVLFGAAIHFSRYRQTAQRCCTAGLSDLEEDFEGCDTCPNRDSDECALNEEEPELLEIK